MYIGQIHQAQHYGQESGHARRDRKAGEAIIVVPAGKQAVL